jgi:acyl carrier protein
MAIKSTIVTAIREIADKEKKTLPPLTDDLVLFESGLDSLAIAILVARLEDTLGVDPFIEETAYPVTLGDFIALYERALSRETEAGHVG